MIDAHDGQILHALQLSPRASFRLIADVVGLPEQTVARRYRRMRRDGLMRVVGVVNPAVYGEVQWVVRLAAGPDDVPRLAEALVRRPEVTHANVLSGWAELICVVRAPITTGTDSLLRRLPRTKSVLTMDIDLVLHAYGEPTTTHWTAYGSTLDPAQRAQLVSETITPTAHLGHIEPTRDDQALLDALAEDGRTTHAGLAHRTGWSTPRVARRLTALEAAGTLTYDVDLLPERLGFAVNAMLWLTTTPTHVHSVGAALISHDEVATVAAITGRHNLMAVVICRDVDHLYRFVAEQLATVEHIASYGISIRAQRLKQTTSLVTHGRLAYLG